MLEGFDQSCHTDTSDVEDLHDAISQLSESEKSRVPSWIYERCSQSPDDIEAFLEYTYQPSSIRFMCLIGAIWFLYDFSSTCFGCSFAEDGAGGSGAWVLGTWVAEAIAGLTLLTTVALLSTRRCMHFCRKNYNSICSMVLVVSYFCMIFPPVMIELRRSRFQSFAASHQWDHVHWTIDYSQIPPTRTCNNSQPLLSWQNHTDQTDVGCNSAVLSGSIYNFLLLVTLLPTAFKMTWRACFSVTCANTLLYLAALLSTGSYGVRVAAAVAFQFVAGFCAAGFCAVGRRTLRDEFAVERSIERAQERSASLLYTLIPRNVMARLAAHDPARMLGCAVPHCTILFCAFEQVPGPARPGPTLKNTRTQKAAARSTMSAGPYGAGVSNAVRVSAVSYL